MKKSNQPIDTNNKCSKDNEEPSGASTSKPSGYHHKPPPQSKVRQFIEAKRLSNDGKVKDSSPGRIIIKTRKSNTSTLFNEELPSNEVPLSTVREARKNGILNLSSKNLTIVPSKVWRINEIEDTEKSSTLSVSLDNQSGDEQKWWEFMELQKLIIANNVINEIPQEIGQLFSLVVLDAHDNKIDLIAPQIGCLENLQKLDLSHNRIRQLPEEVFNLPRLKELKLSHNGLDRVSKDIGRMATLIDLDLSHNLISRLPEDIGFLSNLTKLDVSHNKLTELPHDFSGLTGLQFFDASFNCIFDVRSLFGDFNHLEILNLNQNRLKCLPIVTNCKNLKEVYLQNNRITEFDSSIFANTRIQVLDLKSNKISMIDVNRNDLEYLDRFYLENNDISELPNDLAMLPAIKSLTLEGNPLRGIRVDIIQRGTRELLKYLRGKVAHLYVDNTNSKIYETSDTAKLVGGAQTKSNPSPRSPITSAELGLDYHKLKNTHQLHIKDKVYQLDNDVFEVAEKANVNRITISTHSLSILPKTFENVCPFLIELVLDYNKFQSLPGYIGTKCPNLEYLSFQSNQISDLPSEFGALRKLREINMAYNKFTKIPSCIYELPQLEILWAPENKITAIDIVQLEKLRSLATLNLRNNSIDHVPPQLGNMTSIKNLNIDGNLFRAPTYAILQKGTEATMQFLRNRILP